MTNKTTFVHQQNTKVGIVLVVIGLSVAALIGALMKLLSTDMHAIQITWVRFVFFFVFLLPIIFFRVGKSALRPPRPGVQFFRGISLAGATVAFVAGATQIPFADAIAILYAYPFLLTVLAVVFLDEKVSAVGWLGVLGGFFGVILVMRPSFSSFNVGTLYVFLSAIILSIQMTFNRQLGKASNPIVTSFWGAIVATLVLSVFIWNYWQPLNFYQFWVLILISFLSIISQLCIVFGFAKAEASAIAPFTYLEIVAALIYGVLLFGTIPSLLSWIGISFIAFSGILVARSLSAPLAPRRNPKI